ncbi:two-component regulator propeller domain-containing protein [Flavobacterium sp. JP2137]|uniref:two-component regulator propeller domain-containing protein n=1 Tax=Flavobacterium sp. JP2137 TaxID=3414510 RepID=UPI003D2FC2DF
MKCFPIVLFLLFFQYHFAQSTDTKIYNSNNGLISNYVSKVFVDSKDDLWVGTRAGLAKKVMNRFEQEPNSILYKFNNIFDILEDDENGMWIAGYGQGVLYFHNNQSKLIDVKSGLISNQVRTLYSTGGKIYAGTQNGVSIISTKDLSIKNPKFSQNKSYFFEVSSFFRTQKKFTRLQLMMVYTK